MIARAPTASYDAGGKLVGGALLTYVNQFKAGGSQRDVQESIINLPEYANTPPPPATGTVGLPIYPL